MGLTIEAIEQARKQFPQEYRPVDEDFRREFAEPIEQLKSIFADHGGIKTLSVGGKFQIICRLPSREIIQTSQKQVRQQQLDDVSADLLLLRKVLLYPSIDTVEDWVKGGNIGVPSAFIREIFRLTSVTAEATSGEL